MITMLKHDVEGILEKADYDYSEYRGCFDIIAKRSEILLLKVLENVDSLQKEQAANMKILARSLFASPAVVGLHTRKENLYDDIVYDRFDIPTFTPKTLENILVRHNWPLIYRFRGGLFAEVDSEKLREGRKQLGLSQSQLAKKVKITKKSVYEHEKKKMLLHFDTAKRLEKLIGKITSPMSFWEAGFPEERKSPITRFEREISEDLKRMGFETDLIHQAPFNIIAKTQKFLVFSDAEENPRQIEKNEDYLVKFSEIVEKPVLVITKKKVDIGLPVVDEREIKSMTKRDIIRAVEGW